MSCPSGVHYLYECTACTLKLKHLKLVAHSIADDVRKVENELKALHAELVKKVWESETAFSLGASSEEYKATRASVIVVAQNINKSKEKDKLLDELRQKTGEEYVLVSFMHNPEEQWRL